MHHKIPKYSLKKDNHFDNPEPFAIRSVPPFTQSWTIGDSKPGCHAFFVEATDTAGNTVRSKTVSACVGEAEEE